MQDTTERVDAADRVVMALIGAGAGFALWLFADVLPDVIADQRVLLFLAALVLGSFAILMALSGPVRLARAALGAVLLAAPAAVLALWGSLRFDGAKAFIEAGHGVLAYLVIVFVATPFIAAGLQARGGWKRYDLLFETSWTIVVRYAAAWLFTGLFWAVVMLSNELLRLVGVSLIARLIAIDGVSFVLSGAVLGLAMAVVHELRDYVSPYLIHRLLRLLLPVLLVVVAVFIAALPLRGLGGLFGSFSAAATLMAVTFAAVTLISTVLDRGDDEVADGRVMILATRALALSLPVLAGLSVYAVALRVDQYGWTPHRLLAGLGAAFLLVYALAYAVAVLRGGGWMARIRRANRITAMALVAVAALWLSPLVNAERISTASQIARFEAGKTSLAELALWEMAHDWGRPGRAGLVRLEAQGGSAELTDMIARAREARSRFVYERQVEAGDQGALAGEVQAMLALRPEGAGLPEGALEQLPPQQLRAWAAACRRRLEDGRPGCVAVFGGFMPGLEVPHGMVLLNGTGDRVRIEGFKLVDGRVERMGGGRRVSPGPGASAPGLTAEAIGRVLDGDFTIAPTRLQALRIGDLELIPDN